jgi:phosphate transport system protein
VRSVFREQLGSIEARLDACVELASATLEDVAVSVADTARPTPSSIERAAETLRRSQRDLSESIATTMACQAPVAGDLRLILALMEITHHTGLIANQFDLINVQLMETDPDVPDELGTGTQLARMARLANSELAEARAALRKRDCELARRIAAQDKEINRINRQVFAKTIECGEDELKREVAMRHVLIARSLERIGDNAVDIAEQTVFLVTGEPCEFSDASHPAAA